MLTELSINGLKIYLVIFGIGLIDVKLTQTEIFLQRQQISEMTQAIQINEALDLVQTLVDGFQKFNEQTECDLYQRLLIEALVLPSVILVMCMPLVC
jgi:hypothetical protein